MLKKIFCKHEWKKTGTERINGILNGGEVTGGKLFIRCRCKKCDKLMYVEDSA